MRLKVKHNRVKNCNRKRKCKKKLNEKGVLMEKENWQKRRRKIKDMKRGFYTSKSNIHNALVFLSALRRGEIFLEIT